MCRFCGTYSHNKSDYTEIRVVMEVSNYNKSEFGENIPKRGYIYTFALNYCPECGRKLDGAGTYKIKEE